ncbi:hypothetical protein [Streptomyces niveus]|uniref:hypothetical protein n=1 Tax=Streptomyces niveus TaxID=193462 RepID=UPI00365FCC84
MGPEVLVAAITAVSVMGAALIAALPALIGALRRAREAVEADGAVTRDHLVALQELLSARISDVRDDIDDVREDVSRVREWQAGHDAEHLLIGRQRPGGETP